MKKVKCVNGHFFDADRFSNCPSCGAAPVEPLRVPDQGGVLEAPVTRPLYPIEGFPPPISSLGAEDNPPHNDPKPDGDSPMGPLAIAVEETGSKETIALPKTTPIYCPEKVDPPVGWLVCIRGIYTGRAFECKAGRNRIGRNLDMDICLSEDLSISRDVHAAIIYEPKNRIFYLQAGTSSGLTYRNGNLIFDHEELHAYDKVEVGKAEFVFFPLCGEKFTWDDYMEED